MPLPPLETTRYAVDQGIATITLARPDKLNAYNARMRLELELLLDETDADDEVRVVIVTGAGRAFCAGADLSSGGNTFDRSAHAGDPIREALRVGEVYRDGGGTTTLRMYRSLKPIIGAINGAAVGIGVTMQLPMDIRMASTAARFGFVFARRGITPEAASSWYLPRLVGMQTALEWCPHGPRVQCRRGAGARPRALAACPGRAPAGGARTGPRDRRQHGAGVDRVDASDAVADVGCAASHVRPPGRQPRDPDPRAVGRRA
jgi:enoyl-CoA hydratase/carnithine racemase